MQCTARRKNGEPCQGKAVKGKSVCRMHGAKAGRPVTHGRRSAAYARIFGDSFLGLLKDPDLLKADAELALFDQFLTERAEGVRGGLGGEWLDELAKTVAEVDDALFGSRDAGKLKASFDRLKVLVQEGGDRNAAWQEVLAAARSRGELAIKADAIVAKRDATVSESQMVAVLGKMLDIVADVAGADTAKKTAARFQSDLGACAGAGNGSAGVGSAVH